MVRTITAGADTLVFADNGKTILCTNAVGTTVTIPLNASVSFPLNTRIELVATVAGLTISDATVTLVKPATVANYTLADGGTIIIRKVAADAWSVTGQLDVAA